MVADTGPSCIDTLTMEDSGSFTSADPQVARHQAPRRDSPANACDCFIKSSTLPLSMLFPFRFALSVFACSRGYVNFMHDLLLDFADPIITQKKVGRYLID